MLFVLIRGLWTLCEESHIVTNNFNFNSRLFDKYCTGKKPRKVRRIRNTTSISATDKLRNRTRTALIALHQTTFDSRLLCSTAKASAWLAQRFVYIWGRLWWEYVNVCCVVFVRDKDMCVWNSNFPSLPHITKVYLV